MAAELKLETEALHREIDTMLTAGGEVEEGDELIVKSTAEIAEVKYSARDDGEYEDYDEYNTDEDYDEEENHQFQQDKEAVPYQSELSKTLHKVGKTTITKGQAALFGIKQPKRQEPTAEKLAEKLNSSFNKVLGKIKSLSEPRKSDLSHVKSEDDYESTFKPSRSKKALLAMRAAGCGYDFIDRLESEKDGFLARAFSNNGKSKVDELKQQEAEERYKVSLDKLACPQCKAKQSFDEFWEKKRFCQRCQVRYVKLNVCDPVAFERRMKKQEEKRQHKIKKVEQEMYSYKKKEYKKPKEFALDLPSGSGPRSASPNKYKEETKSNRPGKSLNDGESKSAGSIIKPAAMINIDSSSTGVGLNKEITFDDRGVPAEVLLRKLAQNNQAKAAALEGTILAMEGTKKEAAAFMEGTKKGKTVDVSGMKKASKAKGGSTKRRGSKENVKNVRNESESKSKANQDSKREKETKSKAGDDDKFMDLLSYWSQT